MASPRVFVTYHFVDVTHRDYQFAIGLINDLRTAGVDVMAEGTAMQHGNFVQYLNEVLPTCQWLILVQTPDALHSQQVQMVVNTALTLVVQQRMRGVLPVIAILCEPQEVPVTWATLKTYDATLDYQRTLARVLLTLGLDLVSSETQSAFAPPPSHIITSSSTIDKPVGHPSKPGLRGTRDFSSPVDRPEKLTPGFTAFERTNAIPESHSKRENHPDTPIPLSSPTRQHRKRWLTALSVALALVLLITSVVLADRSFSKSSPHPTASITSDAIAELNATATANANTTATVDANLTATGREVNATTTAIAQANASAIANENATATATSVALAQPGTKWTTQQSGTSNYFWHIAWSGTKYVLVGDGGAIFTSDDGITWIPQNSNTSNNLIGITASTSQYVAVGGAGTILTSSNGITWVSQTSNTLKYLLGITWSGSKFIAVGRAGAILSSP